MFLNVPDFAPEQYHMCGYAHCIGTAQIRSLMVVRSGCGLGFGLKQKMTPAHFCPVQGGVLGCKGGSLSAVLSLAPTALLLFGPQGVFSWITGSPMSSSTTDAKRPLLIKLLLIGDSGVLPV